MLRNPSAKDWLMLRHDYSATSFSPLAQITAANVKLLQLAWIWPMHEGGTNQPAPIVYNGTMYLANTGGIVQALDARTGKLIWEHHVGADIAPRGIALYGNKLIFQSAREWAVRPQEARLIALDARDRRDGLERRRCPTSTPTNSGPLVANGLLIQGMGTCTVYENNKCFISAYDPADRRAALALSHRRARPASPAATAGAICRICTARARRRGSPAATIPSSTSPTGARRRRSRGCPRAAA